MKKNNIGHIVELYTDDVTLSIYVTPDLKYNEKVSNFGNIQVGGWIDEKKNCNWDGINFFMTCTKKEFMQECKQELKDKDFAPKEIRKAITRLIKRAIKIGILK